MEPSEKDRQHHTEMVFKLAECFSSNSQEWNSIINQCLSMKYISKREMGGITSMEDLCQCLMKNEIIRIGDYKRLRKILGNNGEAKGIIDKYTKLIRGEKDGCENYDSGSDEDEPSNTPKRPKAEEDDSHQFRKEMDNTHDARIIDVWGRARQSVGLIKGLVFDGTGFRVGTDYIMTAYHVAADITKQHKSDQENWAHLGKENVWIEFKFPEKYVGKKFHFEPKLIIGSKELDYAILKLSRARIGLEIPEPIRKFQKIDYKELFAMLGFPQEPNNEIMQFDSDIKLFDLKDVNSDRRNLMIKNGEAKPGYTGICDDRKVLFDCWVQHGASGSPGIVMGNDKEEPVCTLMLLCGYPVHAFSSGARVPRGEMIEQGIKMETIADELSRNGESGQDLKRDIFGDCFS